MESIGQGIVALVEWVIPVWTVAVGLIGLFIWLYVLKKKHGWTHWRVAPPRFFARAVGWVLWVIAKKIPWKPLLIWGPWVVMLLGVGFYGIENWRGKRAWDKFKAEVKGRGQALEFDHYLPEIPDEENVLSNAERVTTRAGNTLPQKGSSATGSPYDHRLMERRRADSRILLGRAPP